MEVTVKFKLEPSSEQSRLLEATTGEYIAAVNRVAGAMRDAGKLLKLSSKDVEAPLPSALKNQAIRDAKSVFRASGKRKRFPVLRKPVAIWNNQNHRVREDAVEIPVWCGGRSKRIRITASLSDYQRERLRHRHGTLRITKKNGKWIAQLCVTVPEPEEPSGNGVMGVDLGLKVPAVAVTDAGRTRFFGNGRKRRHVRRKFRVRRKRLGKAKKVDAIRRSKDKEQRWMRDEDHKTSRRIVEFAGSEGVRTIRLELLKNIRNTARTSRKNEQNLHNWSFHRLMLFIGYKARLAGIAVEYVDPAYTSRTCPFCGRRNRARDRLYKCPCGYKDHRDRVGARNIMVAPSADGVAA